MPRNGDDHSPNRLVTNHLPSSSTYSAWSNHSLPLLDGGQGKTPTTFPTTTLLCPCNPAEAQTEPTRTTHPPRAMGNRREIHSQDSARGDTSHTLLAGFPPHDIGKVAQAQRPLGTGYMPLITDNEYTTPATSSHSLLRPGRQNTEPSNTLLAALPPDDVLEGLRPPQLNDYSDVTGATTGRLRSENKHRRVARQATQGHNEWWTTHTASETEPRHIAPPTTYLNNMCPQRMALHHPAAATLLEYATNGCPTRTGAPWSRSQLDAAIRQGPP